MRHPSLPFLAIAASVVATVWGCRSFSTDPAASLPDGGGTTPAADADLDADASDPGRCARDGAFGAPSRVEGLSTAGNELGVWLSPNEKRAYVTYVPIGGTNTDILVSTRPTRDAVFLAPQSSADLASLNTAKPQTAVTLSTDELWILYQDEDPVTGPVIMAASRTSSSKPFDPPREISVGEGGNGKGVHPFLTEDSSLLYFARHDASSAYRIVSSAASGPPAFVDAPKPVNDLASVVDTSDDHPVVARNGRTIFFSSTRAGGSGGSDIWMAERANLDVDFGAPVNLGAVVNGPADDFPSAVSEDGCVLYFISDRQTNPRQSDIWRTQRAAAR
jgi:hypothetical protein